MNKVIHWYKLEISFYQEGDFFAVKRWQDVLKILEKHVGWDVKITAQYSELENEIPKYDCSHLYTGDNVEGLVYVCSEAELI